MCFKRRSPGVCLEYKQHQAHARCWRRFCKAVDQRLRATGGAGHKSSEERGDELLLAKASLLAERRRGPWSWRPWRDHDDQASVELRRAVLAREGLFLRAKHRLWEVS